MALKIEVHLPFGSKFPVEFEPFDQKIFGQRLMYISYSILRDRSAWQIGFLGFNKWVHKWVHKTSKEAFFKKVPMFHLMPLSGKLSLSSCSILIFMALYLTTSKPDSLARDVSCRCHFCDLDRCLSEGGCLPEGVQSLSFFPGKTPAKVSPDSRPHLSTRTRSPVSRILRWWAR